MKHITNFFKSNPVWYKVILFSSTLFFLQIADAIISYWAPNEIERNFASPAAMGFIIGFQSVVGFIADLFFPHIFKKTKSRILIFWGTLVILTTSLFLVGASAKPFVAIFLATMFFWGIYYELITFARFQFVGSVVPANMRTGSWGIMGTFTNLAYFLGPLIAVEILYVKSNLFVEGVIGVFLFIAFLLVIFSKKAHDAPAQISFKEVNPLKELTHWFTLYKCVWPAIVLSLLMGFIDSTFWTIGAIWTEKLSTQGGSWGMFFLPMYQVPALFVGFLLAKWGIHKGKKILTEKLLILAGVFLIGLAFAKTVGLQLGMVFFASLSISVAYPLLDGVYSDIVSRMGKEKNHLIGLTSSTINISYIVWPPIAGLICSKIGEMGTFGILGALVVAVSFVLLFITPKKLRLPQGEIQTWKD
ncbi:MAG: MFS transporter [Candidatus Woesebacteria bacterium]|nr:MFS transporter [Candidatus Woesebacteria bacterium]